MKYISLALLSFFLFACSQESAVGANEVVLSDKAQNIEQDVMLARKYNYDVDFSAERTVTRYPRRMQAKTRIEARTQQTGNQNCTTYYGISESAAFVFDKDYEPTHFLPYSADQRTFTFVINKNDIYRVFNYNDRQYHVSTMPVYSVTQWGDRISSRAEKTRSCSWKNVGVIGVHQFAYGPDTVTITTSANLQQALADSLYRDVIRSYVNSR